MRDKLLELIHDGAGCPDGRHPFGDVCDGCKYFPSLDCGTERLADHLIANGVTFADDNNVGDKEMIRHLFNRCAAITQCGLCFCCGYQKECESTRDIRKGG